MSNICGHTNIRALCLLFRTIKNGSCLKTGQHSIFVIIYQLLLIKCIIFDFVSKILFFLLPIIIMILILKILLHNVYKIINLRYPAYVYPFLNFLIITKIECWPVFKQDPQKHELLSSNVLTDFEKFEEMNCFGHYNWFWFLYHDVVRFIEIIK